MALKIYDKSLRTRDEQIEKNKEDIEDLKSVQTPYIIAGDNVTVEYSTDNKQCTINAELTTAIDDSLSPTSPNPVSNRCLTGYYYVMRDSTNRLYDRMNIVEPKVEELETNKQDKFTVGSGLRMEGTTLVNAREDTYHNAKYHSGLLISEYSDRTESNKDIYVPLATETNAGVVNKAIMTPIVIATIQQILPQIAPMFFPKAGEIIQTINADYNPNNEYIGTTWRKFKDGIYFSSGSIAEHRAEQLPNITGDMPMYVKAGSRASSTSALYEGDYTTNNPTAASSGGYNSLKFKASRNNSIYTDNGKVRPNTFTTYSWIRVDGLSQEVMNNLEQYLQ